MLDRDFGALRETTLALDVFRRDGATYDSAADPIVRVEMTRLRSRLAQYYADVGPRRPDGHRGAEGKLRSDDRAACCRGAGRRAGGVARGGDPV